MINITRQLNINLNQLELLKKRLQMLISNAPSGSIRCSQARGRKPRYYLQTPATPKSGKYIKQQDIDVARAIASREYHEELLAQVEMEIKAIKKLLKSGNYVELGKIYEKLHANRKALIEPIVTPIDDFAKTWQAIDYEKKPMSSGIRTYATNRGEIVRSKSEKMYADNYLRRGVPYRYEYPHVVRGYNQPLYPDFTLLSLVDAREIIHEHLGMMSDPGYVEGVIWRLDIWEKNGYILGENLILTYESEKTQMTMDNINRKIDHVIFGK